MGRTSTAHLQENGDPRERRPLRKAAATEADEEWRKNFLQGLKPNCFRTFTPGLKPRPPKDKAFSASWRPCTDEERARLPDRVGVNARRLLQGREGGEFGGGDGFLLEEDLEAFAHAFGVDERFELQARADAAGFIHAVIVEVGELVSLP